MAEEKGNPVFTDGSVDWSSGVDSLKTPTAASPTNPNGLSRNQLAWGTNLTMRDGSLSPRDGWVFRGMVVSPNSLPNLLGSTFQGKTTYVPVTGVPVTGVPVTGNPYEIWVVGGHVLKVDPTFSVDPVDLTEVSGFGFVSITTKAYFCQGVNYLIIQSGNYNSQTKNGELPLIWDGGMLRRSNGITGVLVNGAPQSTTFIVNVTSSFTIPADGAIGTPAAVFTMPILESYKGNQYDKITIMTDGGTALGTFEVMNPPASGMFQLEYTAVASPSQGGNTFGTSVNPYTISYVNAGNQTITAALTPFPEAAGPPFTDWPHSGSITITFSISSYVYPGAIGDVLQIFLGSTISDTPVGQWQVTSFSAGKLTINCVGTNPNPNSNQPTASFIRIYNAITGTQYYTRPQLGNTVAIPFSNAGPDSYIGSIGDSVTINGDPYVMVGYGGLPSWQSGTGVIFRQIYTGTIPPQQTLPFTLSLTVTSVPSFIGSNINQIPAALAMLYYMGRIWYSTGATVNAGDIIGGPSGTLANNFTDSILAVTENPLVVGGDGFTMPSGNDNITGLAVPQMINASLGQGLLNIGTPNSIFALQVPVSRADWIAAGTNNQPDIFVVQSGTATGFVNDWDVCPINGDLWYTSPDAETHSLLTAVRYFLQWSNPILSSNEDRIISLVNSALLNMGSSVYFNTRRLGLTLPQQSPYGVYFPSIIPLDLTTISTLETQDPPNWEGAHEGLQWLKLDTATFGNQQRLFGAVLSPTIAGQMEVWENVIGQVGDQNQTQNNRIQWQATMASFTAANEFQLKELQAGELWLDKIQGIVDVEVEYCPDGSSCFYKWCAFSVCSATDSSQVAGVAAYPITQFQPGLKKPLMLPHPPEACGEENSRPAYHAFEFQPRITIRGQCRLRGFRLHMTARKLSLYEYLVKCFSNWAKSVFTSILGG